MMYNKYFNRGDDDDDDVTEQDLNDAMDALHDAIQETQRLADELQQMNEDSKNGK